MNPKWFLAAAMLMLVAMGRPAESAEHDASAVTSHIPRERVQSSALATIGYSKRRHILEVEFVNGAVYRYFDVPPSVYRDMTTAESKTRYYDWKIKRNYRSVRVRARVKDRSEN